MSTAERLTGTIHALTSRGFGFIRADGKDYFFHHTDLLAGRHYDTLTEGEAVEFRGEATARGMHAREVRARPLEDVASQDP